MEKNIRETRDVRHEYFRKFGDGSGLRKSCGCFANWTMESSHKLFLIFFALCEK